MRQRTALKGVDTLHLASIDEKICLIVDYQYLLTNYFLSSPEGYEQGLPLVIQLGEQIPLGPESMGNEVKLRLKALKKVVSDYELELKIGIGYNKENIDTREYIYVGIVSDPNYVKGRKLPRIILDIKR